MAVSQEPAWAIPEGYRLLEQDSPFQQGFGTLYYKPRDGGAFIAFRVQPQHINRYGNLHGGAMAAFMDAALGNSVLLQPLAPAADVTVSLTIDYMAAGGAGAWIVAEVVVPKMGKRLAFAHCEVRSAGRVIATGRGIFSLGMPHTESSAAPH